MIEELVRRYEAGDGDDTLLAQRAAERPESFAPYALRLVDAGAAWRPDLVYRAGDAEFQRELIRRVDAGAEDGWFLVHVLAQTRGPDVEAAFRRWADAAPPGIDSFGRGVDALVSDGGWELSEGSGHRDLFSPIAYRLEPVTVPSGASDQLCPWCGAALWRVLDVDTADPRVAEALAHTGWQGRLRVEVCAGCAAYDTVFVDVAADGGSACSSHTTRPSSLPDLPAEEPPTTRFAVGARLPNAYQADAWVAGGSTLGGLPDYIQDPPYERCPSCGRYLDYVGLVNGADAWDGEGAFYLSLHTACGLAAVSYQQS